MKIVPFSFESSPVRVADKDGEPWFVAKDVCDVLGLANSRDALEKLDDDEKGVALTDTHGGKQEMQIISESGLYALVLRCRDAMTPGSASHRFRKWVTADVLPTIRKTGGYGIPDRVAEEIERTFGIVRMLAHKLTETEKKISKLEAKIEVNPHHAVPEYLAPLDLAIEYGAHQRGRRPLCRVLGNRMEKRAREMGVQESVVRTISGRRLFEQRFARVFMREAGLALIASHNHRAASAEAGQGVIRFPARAG